MNGGGSFEARDCVIEIASVVLCYNPVSLSKLGAYRLIRCGSENVIFIPQDEDYPNCQFLTRVIVQIFVV